MTHTLLINKYLEHKINNKLLYLVMDLKIAATLTIDIKGHLSKKIIQTIGNRQGGILEPLEWIVF